jgi:hypothetical protein
MTCEEAARQDGLLLDMIYIALGGTAHPLSPAPPADQATLDRIFQKASKLIRESTDAPQGFHEPQAQ